MGRQCNTLCKHLTENHIQHCPKTDSTYGDDAGLIAIQFNHPKNGELVDYGLFYSASHHSATSTSNIYRRRQYNLIHTNSAITGGLPVQQNTIVTVDDVLQDTGYNIEFTMTSAREYAVDDWQFYAGEIQNAEVEVYLNNELIVKNVDYRWNGANGSVTLSPGVGNVGDNLEIFVINDGPYAFGYIGIADDSTRRFIQSRDKLYFDTATPLGATVKVTTLSNHDSSRYFFRTRYDMLTRKTLVSWHTKLCRLL